MRIIPKNTKVRLQFYRNITLLDVVIAFIALSLICLALSSNLSSKWIISLIILIIVAPLYISLGELRLYQMLGYLLKFIFAKKQFSKASHGKTNIALITPYLKIANGIIYQKNNYFTGVIKVTPINFNLFNESKQDFLIDNVFASVFKSLGIYQSIGIVKVDEPLILDDYIKSELNKIQNLISANENKALNELELRSRIQLIEDRINTIDYINSKEKIFTSNYYLTIHDLNIENLKNLLNKIENTLTYNNITAHTLDTAQLHKFIKYTYTKNFEEREFIDNCFADILPNNVKFKINKVIQDKEHLSHFLITDYPLQVGNAWGQELFNLPNTKVVLKAEPVEKTKAIKRIDSAINELLSQKNLGKTSFQIDKETHLSSLQSTLIGLQNDNENFFDVSLIITVYDELTQNKNKKIVKQKLKELGFKFNELFGRQIDGYITSLITKDIPIKQYRGITSSVLSACFPFVGEMVMDKNGFLIGENESLAFFNPFKRTAERVNSNMVIIGKSGSGKSIANAQMLLVLKWLDNEIIKNREYNELNNTNRKIIIVIDEAHVFVDEKYPIALDFMYQLAKRIRKYNGMQIVITQNIKDFTGNWELTRKASAIINASQYSLIFNLPPSDMNDLCSLYEKSGQLNKTESDIITNLPRGYSFLIISPQNRTTINIHASKLVQDVFNKVS